jgi:hypothetical protein
MNSARPPQDRDFCMGIWKKTGLNKYKLNHFAWLANDTANAPSGVGNPAGSTRFFEEITLAADGNHYTGKFTLECLRPVWQPGRAYQSRRSCRQLRVSQPVQIEFLKAGGESPLPRGEVTEPRRSLESLMSLQT